MSTNVKKHNTASASRIAHRYVQSALIGDPKELLEIYESKLKLYEGEARTAQEIQDFIDKNIESQADEIGLSYSRMNAELRSGKPNLWNELATIWEFRKSKRECPTFILVYIAAILIACQYHQKSASGSKILG
jgi:hypothetical protein